MDSGRIQMRLYASLKKWEPNHVSSYAPTGGKTVRELLRDTGIPEHEVAIIMVNGKRRQLETALEDGDVVSLFPLIGGG